jgi:hypothetical protein
VHDILTGLQLLAGLGLYLKARCGALASRVGRSTAHMASTSVSPRPTVARLEMIRHWPRMVSPPATPAG